MRSNGRAVNLFNVYFTRCSCTLPWFSAVSVIAQCNQVYEKNRIKIDTPSVLSRNWIVMGREFNYASRFKRDFWRQILKRLKKIWSDGRIKRQSDKNVANVFKKSFSVFFNPPPQQKMITFYTFVYNVLQFFFFFNFQICAMNLIT